LGFSPAGLTLFSSTGFYSKTNRVCPELKEGKSLIGEEYRGKSVYFLIPENYQEIQEFHHFPIIC
jgi:hypothetical protein